MKISCKCCTKHVPLPMVLRSIVLDGEVIFLCPTTFENLQKFIDECKDAGGKPPGSVRKHYSEYVQGIAARIV